MCISIFRIVERIHKQETRYAFYLLLHPGGGILCAFYVLFGSSMIFGMRRASGAAASIPFCVIGAPTQQFSFAFSAICLCFQRLSGARFSMQFFRALRKWGCLFYAFVSVAEWRGQILYAFLCASKTWWHILCISSAAVEGLFLLMFLTCFAPMGKNLLCSFCGHGARGANLLLIFTCSCVHGASSSIHFLWGRVPGQWIRYIFACLCTHGAASSMHCLRCGASRE